MSSCAAMADVGLDDQRSLFDDFSKQIEISRNPRARRGNFCCSQQPRNQNLVLRRNARAIWVHKPRALRVKHAREAQRKLAAGFENI